MMSRREQNPQLYFPDLTVFGRQDRCKGHPFPKVLDYIPALPLDSERVDPQTGCLGLHCSRLAHSERFVRHHEEEREERYDWGGRKNSFSDSDAILIVNFSCPRYRNHRFPKS